MLFSYLLGKTMLKTLLFMLIFLDHCYALEKNIQKQIFSHSILLINGANTIAITSDNKKFKGILTSIDWSKIPDFGLPKNEIHTIQVLERKNRNYTNNRISLSPTKWRFIAKKWSRDFIGSIPYLEKLDFLPKNITNQLKMNNEIFIKKNNLGYYQNLAIKNHGIYPAVNQAQDHTISQILIISSEDNQEIYNMSQKLDTVIIQEEIMKDISIMPIDIEEISNNNIQTNKQTNKHSINSTNKTTSTKNKKQEESVLDKSINTSVDKRANLNN